MTEFAYQPMFPLGKDDSPYRKLTGRYEFGLDGGQLYVFLAREYPNNID